MLAFVLVSATPITPDTTTIVLRAEPLPFTPNEFYVASITDERPNQDAVALLHLATTAATPTTRAQPVDLEGGGLTAISNYIRKSLPANPKLRPVTVRLQECRITETLGATGRVQGHVEVAMAFDLQQADGAVQLLTYKGGAKYNRPANELSVVEPALRQSLAGALTYFNTWINKEASNHPNLANRLSISVKEYSPDTDNDTVFYAVNRPLVWADFKASPRAASKFAASVFPGFAYEGKTNVADGEIKLDIALKVYVLKSSSWVKPVARNPYGLNHEQRHFDIVKLIAARFKQKLTPENLTLEDYNSIMQYLYLESFREMNRLQEQYDAETQHGINQDAQERWNKRIDTELRPLNIN